MLTWHLFLAYFSYLIDASEEQRDRLEAQIDDISKDVGKRKKKWVGLRKYLSSITTEKFDTLLRLNQYSGNLSWDHKEHKLDITVRKESDVASNVELTDTKGLSGGERSFTTLCLLLALGEKLETPFRIFDGTFGHRMLCRPALTVMMH